MKKTAFSLLEMSIAILIISILIAGTLQGSRMLATSRLARAQMLTTKSVVPKIDGLVMWLETSFPSSFGDLTLSSSDDTKVDLKNGQRIGIWYDRNPNASVKNHAVRPSNWWDGPKFKTKLINGAIPALSFDGTNDKLKFDGTSLINSPYSIFVVEQRKSGNGADTNYFLGTKPASGGVYFLAGYGTSATFFSHRHVTHQSTYYAIPAFDENVTTLRIHSMLFNTTVGARYWENGGDSPDASKTTQKTPLAEMSYSYIGYDSEGSSHYKGEIAEIIIFNRNVTTSERKAIESYLSRKYSVPISP